MALSSGLSRVCNTKVCLHRTDCRFPQGLKTSCIQTPPQALQLGRGHDPHRAGTLGTTGLFPLIP